MIRLTFRAYRDERALDRRQRAPYEEPPLCACETCYRGRREAYEREHADLHEQHRRNVGGA